jgi:hypothetical protein
VGLLDDAERSLFEDTAVFVGGWTVQAVAQISRVARTRLAIQLRHTLGDDRFDEVFAAGSRLSRREAVAAVSDRYGATGS